MIISWVDWLTRMGGKGGIRDIWPIWSLPVKKSETSVWMIEWYCSPEKIEFRITDLAAPAFSPPLPHRSQEHKYPQNTGVFPTLVKNTFQIFGLSGWHFIFYNYYFLAFTCLRNTWQYCPEKVGPWAERHCCSKPGWLALPPSTLLPIFPNASYTNTQSTQAPPNNTHTHPNSTLCKEQNSGWLDSLDQKRC